MIAILEENKVQHLEEDEGEGNAGKDAELAHDDAAVVWREARGLVAQPAAEQSPQRGPPQEQGHQRAGRPVTHSQQLQVQRQEYDGVPARTQPATSVDATVNLAAAADDVDVTFFILSSTAGSATTKLAEYLLQQQQMEVS